MSLEMSRMFPETQREDPKDAEVPSHRALVRAGYVRRVSSGMYTMLPLAVRAVRNIENIVREEMDAIGGEELRFPALLPREPYELTNRWTEYGDNIFRLQDRRGNDMLLGPTHEEMFTSLLANEIKSYRQLPRIMYQIGTKYRDEARPRSGILRGREFTMKDSYSFDIDDAGLQISYDQHRLAYQRMFQRCGVDVRIVKAISGAMGGSASEEFLAPCETGEDTFVSCPKGDFVANVEAVNFVLNDDLSFTAPEVAKHHTPKTTTIDLLVSAANAAGRAITAADTLKSLVFWADGEAVMAVIPGDREMNEDKLVSFLGVLKLEPFSDDDFKERKEFAKGYISPSAGKAAGMRVIGDHRVRAPKVWVTGADEYNYHLFDAQLGRDFIIDEFADITNGAIGDPCPICSTPLEGQRGIEVGHIFQLGRKYTDAFNWDVLGAEGEKIRPTMGSYGVGTTRMLAVIAEQWLDEKGLVWPPEIAPAKVHIVAATEPNLAIARSIAKELDQLGVMTIVDDRDRASFGVKVRDAELLGMPKIVIVGRDAEGGNVEVRDRKSGDMQLMPIAGLASVLRHQLDAMRIVATV